MAECLTDIMSAIKNKYVFRSKQLKKITYSVLVVVARSSASEEDHFVFSKYIVFLSFFCMEYLKKISAVLCFTLVLKDLLNFLLLI